MPACNYLCGTAAHTVSRRGFLGTAAALGARPGSPTPLPLANSPSPQKRRAGHLPGRRRQPARNRGTPSRAPTPAGRSRRSRPPCPASTSASCCRTPRSRCTAWPSSAAQHSRGRPRQRRRRSCTPAGGPEPGIEYPHLGAVAAKLLGDRRSSAARPHPDHPGGGRRLQQAGRRLPRAASSPPSRSATASRRPNLLRPAGLTDRRPTASARTSGKKLNDRFAQSAHDAPRPRPTPSPTTRPSAAHAGRRDVFDVEQGRPRSSPTATAGTTSAGTAARPPAARSRASRSSRCRTRTTTRTTRTSTSTSSSSASSTGPSPRCSTTWPTAACSTARWSSSCREFGRTPQINRPVRPRPLVGGVVGGPGRLRASRAGRWSARRTPTARPSPTAR